LAAAVLQSIDVVSEGNGLHSVDILVRDVQQRIMNQPSLQTVKDEESVG